MSSLSLPLPLNEGKSGSSTPGKEIMEASHVASVKQAFNSWQDISFKEDEEWATFTWRGSENLNELQSKVYDQLQRASLEVFSLNIRKPDLEDVYRYALGGAQ